MPVRSTLRTTVRPTLRTIGNSSPIGSGGGVWLLADGTWNDNGVWDDDATWPSEPVVTQQPGIAEIAPKAANEVYEGENAVITIAATGATSYQWQTSPDDSTWTNVGASSTTYTISNTVRSTHDGLYIRCRVINAAGTTDSSSFQLSVWNPLELTGMQLWVDATDAATVFEDTADAAEANDPVRIVNDKSGNSRHMTQGTSTARAIWRANAQNGRSAIEFDGVDDFYTSGSVGDWNFLHNGTASLLAIVLQPGKVASPDAIYWLLDSVGASIVGGDGYYIRYDDRSSSGYNDRVISVTASSSAITNLNISADDVLPALQWAILEDAIDADNATAANRSAINVNGGTEQKNNTATAAVSASNSRHTLNVGRAGFSTAYHFSGCIGEIILCNNPNTALRAKLRGFLSYKWGIAVV